MLLWITFIDIEKLHVVDFPYTNKTTAANIFRMHQVWPHNHSIIAYEFSPIELQLHGIRAVVYYEHADLVIVNKSRVLGLHFYQAVDLKMTASFVHTSICIILFFPHCCRCLTYVHERIESILNTWKTENTREKKPAISWLCM